jgi:hypothetical protein
MRQVPQGQGDWRVEAEGIDHVGDGKYASDGIGGLDLHRNFLENWRPMPGLEETGRGYTQGGAGNHPLSEPEVYWFTMWLLSHPNIAAVNYFDTTGPFHLRGPSSSASEERMYPEDIALYEYFDSLAMSITGYPEAGDVYHDFAYARGVTHDPVTGDSIIPFPRFGHGPEFGYFYYGTIWYGDELWNSMLFEDANGDGLLDDVDRLAWDDNHNQGRCFTDWTPFEHPQLGQVEIGGFHPKYCLQNPPTHLLEEWVRSHAMWNLALAQHLPLLELAGVETTEAGERRRRAPLRRDRTLDERRRHADGAAPGTPRPHRPAGPGAPRVRGGADERRLAPRPHHRSLPHRQEGVCRLHGGGGDEGGDLPGAGGTGRSRGGNRPGGVHPRRGGGGALPAPLRASGWDHQPGGGAPKGSFPPGRRVAPVQDQRITGRARSPRGSRPPAAPPR